jgi:hypothetical protein
MYSLLIIIINNIRKTNPTEVLSFVLVCSTPGGNNGTINLLKNIRPTIKKKEKRAAIENKTSENVRRSFNQF